MLEVLLMTVGFVGLGLALMPHEMLHDFWNMLWKKDSGYEEDR
jgi:hypothetical protein